MLTREEVESIAQDCDAAGDFVVITKFLERFAQAVYRRAIEDAAKVCEQMYTKPSNDKDLAGLRKRHKFIVEDCAYCVRKLGEVE